MVEEDIISTLPDPIICHILSFLQTKHSVATTILSKRWNNLWRSLPVLNFSDILVEDQNTYVGFIDFVYSVLLSRDDATLPIKTFHLDFIYHYDLDPLNTITKWVNFVVKHGVENLRLSQVSWGSLLKLFKFPISVLTCSTLVVLKLRNFSVQQGFSPVLLPSLKILHLDYSTFPNLRDFLLFLTRCPILEDLFTFDVVFDPDESLTCDEWKSFCLSNLTRADIDCFLGYFPLKVVHNVLSLRLEIHQVYCRNDPIPTFHNLSRLEFICASLHYSWKFVLEVLNHCPKLQKLDLNEVEQDEVLWTKNDDIENWVDPDFIPQCLSLHLTTCNFFSFLDLQGELMLGRYILKNAKVLQTMTIWNSRQPKIKRQLFSSPMASATCKLTVYSVPYNKEKTDDDMM